MFFQLWSGMVAEAVGRKGEEMNPDPIVAMETRLKVLQICANITDYCHTAMTMGGKSRKTLLTIKKFTAGVKLFARVFTLQVKFLLVGLSNFELTAQKFFVGREGIFISILSSYFLSRLECGSFVRQSET